MTNNIYRAGSSLLAHWRLDPVPGKEEVCDFMSTHAFLFGPSLSLSYECVYCSFRSFDELLSLFSWAQIFQDLPKSEKKDKHKTS